MLQTPDHHPGTCRYPDTLHPRPAERNSLGKIFDFLKLVNEFCGGDENSLPASRLKVLQTPDHHPETYPYSGTLHPGRRNRIPSWNIFDFLKLVNDFPAETNRCRLPGEGAADTAPPPRNSPLPRDLAPRPAEPNSLGKIFDFLKLVNEFCGGNENSLPAARGRGCRPRTTTQELALTTGPCTPAGGTEFPRENFRLFKTG